MSNTAEELLRQACVDLNTAHDEIIKLQGQDPAKYDWPEWSGPANTIRAAEKLLGARLAKTENWTLFPSRSEVPPVDRSQRALSDGSPETPDHREINPATGQQKGYVVLTPEERAKGFVRPVRRSYKHVGPPGPRHPLRDLTDEEKALFADAGYVKFEVSPESESPATGRYWTQQQLDGVRKGCQVVTTMAQSIAETYARDPGFYGGTFCCGCGVHLPLEEFVWEGTNETVGS